MPSVKPGVVTGSAYRDLVAACKHDGYALPAVNITSSSTMNAALEAAANAGSDIIIQLSNGGAQFYAGKGIKDAAAARVIGAVSAARHAQLMAEYYGVAVVMHTDHANRKFVPWVDEMLKWSEKSFKETGSPLYSSHMLDLSEEPLEDNIATCEEFLKRLAAVEMSLEIELGVTGGEEDGIGSELDTSSTEIDSRLYTRPEDVEEAYRRLAPLGHFSVAASFGNVHGVYKPGNVRLRPEILRESQKYVSEKHGLGDRPLDFVFHGGSGSEKEKIEEAVGYGVFKMNIDTDTQFAYATAVGKYVEAHDKAFKYQVDPQTDAPYKKYYDPRVWVREAELSMAARLEEAFRDLGATGRTVTKG
ncbi:class II fructose-bisphosphate aldolase [Thalassospira sp.]|uniref:class II fructose-bisphosphate aldolase n=1 Tax=Thalassospira sp. TaxID=1912094 RepID=UPI002735606D|nr:class II fructose-bisphosphate aldolase [Thalassospira sp.]MDP2697949.1 class II fructose-bisphosphate aldolase [Thalassospira sp.]